VRAGGAGSAAGATTAGAAGRILVAAATATATGSHADHRRGSDTDAYCFTGADAGADILSLAGAWHGSWLRSSRLLRGLLGCLSLRQGLTGHAHRQNGYAQDPVHYLPPHGQLCAFEYSPEIFAAHAWILLIR
jgi:hypothetical protein